jgi:hypothetical protein
MDHEDAQFLAWYDRVGAELRAAWLEEIDPEAFDEYGEFVYAEYGRTGDTTDDGDADYDQWYKIHAIDLMAQWLKSIDPEQFNSFWKYVHDEYEYA